MVYFRVLCSLELASPRQVFPAWDILCMYHGISVSPERHGQSGVNEKLPKLAVEVKWKYCPLDRQPGALTIRPPRPKFVDDPLCEYQVII